MFLVYRRSPWPRNGSIMDHQRCCWCCIGSVPQSTLLSMLQQHPKILTFVVCGDGHTHQWRSECLRKWACTCTTQCATTCPSSVPVLCTLTACGCPVPHCGGYRVPCCWQESSVFSQLLFHSFSLRSSFCHPPPFRSVNSVDCHRRGRQNLPVGGIGQADMSCSC